MFDDLVASAQECNDYSHVWFAFLSGSWYVLVEPIDPAVAGQNFKFVVREFGPNRSPTIFVSEHQEQLATAGPVHAIYARGSDVVRMLQPELGVGILFGNGEVLGMPPSLVADLHSGMSPNNPFKPKPLRGSVYFRR
jgi:hypothetical protein